MPNSPLPLFALLTFLCAFYITSVWADLILVNVKKVWILLLTHEPLFLPSLFMVLFLHRTDMWQIFLHSAELAASSHYIACEAILDFWIGQKHQAGIIVIPAANLWVKIEILCNVLCNGVE